MELFTQQYIVDAFTPYFTVMIISFVFVSLLMFLTYGIFKAMNLFNQMG